MRFIYSAGLSFRTASTVWVHVPQLGASVLSSNLNQEQRKFFTVGKHWARGVSVWSVFPPLTKPVYFMSHNLSNRFGWGTDLQTKPNQWWTTQYTCIHLLCWTIVISIPGSSWHDFKKRAETSCSNFVLCCGWYTISSVPNHYSGLSWWQ